MGVHRLLPAGLIAVAAALAVGLGARRVAGREVEELIHNLKSKVS